MAMRGRHGVKLMAGVAPLQKYHATARRKLNARQSRPEAGCALQQRRTLTSVCPMEMRLRLWRAFIIAEAWVRMRHDARVACGSHLTAVSGRRSELQRAF